MTGLDDFSGILASILSVEQQYSRSAAIEPLGSTLANRETKRVLDSTSPDELLSCMGTQLNTREHQLGVLCILENVSRRKKVGDAPLSPLASELAGLACELLNSCRPKDYVSTSKVWSSKLCSLCVVIARVAKAAGADGGESRMTLANSCIGPLRNGLDCITQSNNRRLTPLNGELLALCVTTRNFTEATTLLGAMPTVFEPERFETDLKHVLNYFLYGSEALLALKRYEEAMLMLTGAVVMPLFKPQPMATAALKKYVLTSLILDGELRELPEYTSSIIKRTMAQDIPDYANLVERARSLGREDGSEENGLVLQSFIAEKRDIWESDGNIELMSIISEELRIKLTLKRYMKTYTTVPKAMLMKGIGVTSDAELDAAVRRFSSAEHPSVQVDNEADAVHFVHASSRDRLPPMSEIRELVRQAAEAKNAVDEDWLEIQTSDLYLKAMLMGRCEVTRKKGAVDGLATNTPLDLAGS